MIKSDLWITRQAKQELITPFINHLVTKNSAGIKQISYGLTSYGYDIRLSPKKFLAFKNNNSLIDPKNFDFNTLFECPLQQDSRGNFFILPAHSYGLGVSFERLKIPEDVSVLCVGKSTYARCGLIANVTPVEAGWEGHLTLEFSNSSAADCILYANEGIIQLQFFQGDQCGVSYRDRKGKYQNQKHEITFAR